MTVLSRVPTATSKAARRAGAAPRPARGLNLLWIAASLALLATSVVLSLPSCSSEPNYKPIGTGPGTNDGGKVCIGPTCPEACEIGRAHV